MSLVNRYESCVGLTLWRRGQRNIEIWFCPVGYEIRPHSHPNEHIELMYLAGKTTFFRKPDADHTQEFTPRWWDIFKRFTVRPGVVHWFKVSKLPLVFVNIATFLDGHFPVSASVDFQEVK